MQKRQYSVRWRQNGGYGNEQGEDSTQVDSRHMDTGDLHQYLLEERRTGKNVLHIAGKLIQNGNHVFVRHGKCDWLDRIYMRSIVRHEFLAQSIVT